MVREPVTLNPDLSIADAADQYFLRRGFAGFPVVSEGRPLGLLSLSEVRACSSNERTQRRVADIMQPLNESNTIEESASVADALRKMTEADIGRLLVTDNGSLIGMITRSGIARFIHFRSLLGSSEAKSAAHQQPARVATTPDSAASRGTSEISPG